MLDKEVFLVSKELTIENTTCCGGNCIMCSRSKYSHPWRHMDDELFKAVVDQGIKLGMLSLDGCGFGDPFIDPHYEIKLRYVKETYPFVKVYTSTTAHLLTPEKIGWVHAYVDTLKISHYGFSKTTFENIHRGALNYEKVVENIEKLIAISDGKRPYIIMQFLILEQNKHEVELWKNYWEKKADEILIWLPHNYGGSQASQKLEEIKTRGIKPRSCGRPFKGNLFVRENGEVSMCCFDFDRKLIIGDLRKQTLEEVLKGERLEHIRYIHKNNLFSKCEYICKVCDQIYPRNEALVYSSNKNRKVGILTSHPDLINDMLR
jgi:MoaA/NifB/PqqE/SkfB family radical SAM enzyme